MDWPNLKTKAQGSWKLSKKGFFNKIYFCSFSLCLCVFVYVVISLGRAGVLEARWGHWNPGPGLQEVVSYPCECWELNSSSLKE